MTDIVPIPRVQRRVVPDCLKEISLNNVFGGFEP